MSELNDIIEGNIEKYDELRAAFFPDDATCYLLSGDGRIEAFQPIVQLVAGWYPKYSNFRGRFELFYATLDTGFQEKLALSGYVAISGDVYQIDQSETVQLQGAKASWRIACKKIGGKKYIPQ